jgi:hypothetical protein
MPNLVVAEPHAVLTSCKDAFLYCCGKHCHIILNGVIDIEP